MKNLKNFRSINLQTLTLIIILILFLKNVSSIENKIIFKINDYAFTSYDYEMRVRYLDFIGGEKNANKELIIEDLKSAYIFYEYYKNIETKFEFEAEINNIFKQINENNIKNNKKYEFKIDKVNILFNIKIDLIRKNILERLLNQNIENIYFSNQEIDLLYIFNIKYINFESKNNSDIKKKINNLKQKNFNDIKKLLINNNIKFFIKEKEINEINKIDKQIIKNVNSKNNYLLIEKNNKISLIFIEKKFETFEGIITNLYSVKSKIEIDDRDLKCENLKNRQDDQNIINKEYDFKDLNDKLKNNLVNINDYIKFSNENEFIYIVLCNIKFNKEILNNIKLNKIVNKRVKNIENNFIKKYSQIYNLFENNG